MNELQNELHETSDGVVQLDAAQTVKNATITKVKSSRKKTNREKVLDLIAIKQKHLNTIANSKAEITKIEAKIKMLSADIAVSLVGENSIDKQLELAEKVEKTGMTLAEILKLALDGETEKFNSVIEEFQS